MTGTATLTTAELAEWLGVSEWALRESVRRGDPPIQPIRVGRRIVWPRAAAERLLQLAPREHEASGRGG